MKKTVVIYGHPYYQMSVSNKTILDTVQKGAPEVEVVNLMKLYPDFRIDVEKEQNRIKDADIIVFQFPFWWYGSPSIMHRYVEDVFSHGFAYGSNGTALNGKKLILSFTTGAPAEAYSKDGVQGYTIEDFMPPFIAIARLCGLELMPSIVSTGMMVFNPHDVEHNNAVIARAQEHGNRLAETIKAI